MLACMRNAPRRSARNRSASRRSARNRSASLRSVRPKSAAWKSTSRRSIPDKFAERRFRKVRSKPAAVPPLALIKPSTSSRDMGSSPDNTSFRPHCFSHQSTASLVRGKGPSNTASSCFIACFVACFLMVSPTVHNCTSELPDCEIQFPGRGQLPCFQSNDRG